MAVDAAQLAVRLGARSVPLVCLARCDEMPDFAWESEAGAADTVEVLCGWGPGGSSRNNGHIRTVEFKACTSARDTGERFNPCFDASKKFTFDARTLVMAIG